MGVKDLWTEALGSFNDSPYRDISEYSGMTLAVDLSIWLNKYCCSNIDKLATTCNPTYPAPDLLENLQRLHTNLSEHVTLVYVFDGNATKLKDATRNSRIAGKEKAGREWSDLRARVLDNSSSSVTTNELETAVKSRMDMKKPTAYDHANVLRWLQSEGVKCIGSLEEADLQMVKLEKDGIVNGIISEDGDEFALGAKKLFCKMKRKKNGQYQFRVLDREYFFDESNPYDSTLSNYPEHVIDAALLLGNDYCPRIPNNGVTKVVLGSLIPLSRLPPNATDIQKLERDNTKRQRRPDSMIHKLAASTNKREWLLQYGTNGESAMPQETSQVYFDARDYMEKAPVLELCRETGIVSVVPLNKVPGGEEYLTKYFEHGGLDQIATNDKLLQEIYHCQILPLERRPLEHYTIKSETSDGTKPAQLFEVLHFDKDPVCIQPKVCLVNWLRARGYDARLFDDRTKIESIVFQCQRLDKPTRGPPLQPIAGQHDGFFNIKPRVEGNSFDSWCTDSSDCYNYVCKMKLITDDYIDDLLGEQRRDRPSMRKRVQRLIKGGFFNPQREHEEGKQLSNIPTFHS